MRLHVPITCFVGARLVLGALVIVVAVTLDDHRATATRRGIAKSRHWRPNVEHLEARLALACTLPVLNYSLGSFYAHEAHLQVDNGNVSGSNCSISTTNSSTTATISGYILGPTGFTNPSDFHDAKLDFQEGSKSLTTVTLREGSVTPQPYPNAQNPTRLRIDIPSNLLPSIPLGVGSHTLTLQVTELAVSATLTATPNFVISVVNPSNHAPTATGQTATLAATLEDTTAPPGSSVSSLFGSRFADSDGTTIATGGVAMIANAATAAQGTWQVKVGTGSFVALPTLTDSTAAIVVGATDLIRFLPASNFNGTPGALTARLWDGTGSFSRSASVQNISASIGGSGAFSDNSNKVTLGTSVTAVNDPPSFDSLPDDLFAFDEDQVTRGPAPQKSISLWAKNIRTGPPDESTQVPTFDVQNSNHAIFAVQPAVSANGTLTFTPAPNAHGTAMVVVVLHDGGGGTDASSPASFKIEVAKLHKLHNAADAGSRNGLDVTGSISTAPDGFISAGDVLAIINYINSKGSGAIPASVPIAPPYCDVDANDQVVALDVIQIINYINSHPGQSEAPGDAVQLSSSQLMFTSSLSNDDSPSAVLFAPESNISPNLLAHRKFAGSISAELMNLLTNDIAAAQSKHRRLVRPA